MTEESSQNHPVEDFLPLSIASLFCCLPLGIAAIIFTVKTQAANNYGDRVRAEKNSRIAFTVGVTGIVLGLIIMFFTASVQLFRSPQQHKKP